MPSRGEEIAQIEAAIAAQEALRPTVGDAIVEAAQAALRAQLARLRATPGDEIAPVAAAATPAAVAEAPLVAAELGGAWMQAYVPRALAEKMRVGGRVQGERRQVTVLFADLSGYTALSERRDPEEVGALSDEVLREFTAAVYQYEGYVEKFAGDAVTALFGAPVAHEDDPERALRAALAMRERLAAVNRRWQERLGSELQLHVGIHSGMVVAGDVGHDLRLQYTVMGDTINTASRLQAAARPGQILVSRDTYRLTHEAFTFAALEPVQIKGKRAPLTVFELLRARLRPGKSRGLAGLGSVFIGREPERAQLRAVLGELQAGRGRIVAVSGEAGIGKSRLLAEWRRDAEQWAHWLEGHAFAHTSGLAFGPFLDLVRRYAGITDEDSVITAADRLRRVVERHFPGDAVAEALFGDLLGLPRSPRGEALLAGLSPEARREQLFGFVEKLFVFLSAERPLVLVLEDLHWADSASIDLLAHLLPLAERRPLAIVVAFRRADDASPARFLAAARARHAGRLSEVPLAPLSARDGATMVERLLGGSLLPRLHDLILAKSEGNPFFVEEVLRSLIEQGALVRAEDGSGWVATQIADTIAVPDTLQGVLMARFDALPEDTKWIGQQAAVIGRTFLYRVLRKMAETSGDVDVELSQLEREKLIRERTREPEVEYIFKHALTQEVAYQSLLTARRRELHRRAAAAIEALFADRIGEFAPIIAAHYYRGEAWDNAATYLIMAGDAAAHLFANPEARQWYGQALESLAHLPDSVDNRQRRVDTTVKLVGVSISSDPPEQNLARLAGIEPLARERAAQASATASDRLRLGRILYWMGRAHYYRGEAAQSLGYYRQVLAVAQELGDPELLAIPASTLGQVMLLIQGQYGKAEPLLAKGCAALAQVGDWTEWSRANGYWGAALAARGDIAAGLHEAKRALERARKDNNWSHIGAASCLLWLVHFMAADAQAMLAVSRDALNATEVSGDRFQRYLAFGLRGWAESRLGQHEAAQASMAESRAIGETLGGRLLLTDWFAAARAELALNADHPEEAVGLAQQAVEAGQAAANVFSQGLAHRTWALALSRLSRDRWDEAEEHFAASVEALESGGIRLEAARSRAGWARLLRDRDNLVAAREQIELAADRFQAAGLGTAVIAVRALAGPLSGEGVPQQRRLPRRTRAGSST
jgi:class 3 adenylate cyclase/tetratricopeptide (TPR) repeat protein